MYTYDRYLTSLYKLKQEKGLTALKEINNDCIAYVDVQDLDIHLPIVEVKDAEHEDYYLNHDFRKRDNELGSPYQKYGTQLNATTNTVLIGHSAFNETIFNSSKSQSIFGKFNNYLVYNSAYNYTIKIETFDQTYTYQVISVMRFNAKTDTSASELEIYNTKNINSQAKFNNFYNIIKEKSVINLTETAEYGDKFVTFFTCSTANLDYRVMVVAKQI